MIAHQDSQQTQTVKSDYPEVIMPINGICHGVSIEYTYMLKYDATNSLNSKN